MCVHVHMMPVCVCYMRMQAYVRTHWSTEGNLGEVCSPLISSQELDLGG